MDNAIFKKAQDFISKNIRNYVESDGGRIEAIKYENNILYVKFGGACRYCPALSLTLKGMVEKKIRIEIPEIKSVEAIN